MRHDNPRADVAQLLRQGAPYREIEQQLHVSRRVITATRHAYQIPLQRHANGGRIPPEERPAIVARVGALLLSGHTYEQISAEVGVSLPTVGRIRGELDIPKAQRTAPVRTVAETLALYTEPYGDGHSRWTGPMRGRMPQLCAEAGRFNGRHVAFAAHHGRRPVGSVRSSCGEVHCMTGAHLTDALIRRTTGGQP